MIMTTTQVSLPLPSLPEEWTAEKDFKAIGTLSLPTKRNIEPVGRHFLAYARRVRRYFYLQILPAILDANGQLIVIDPRSRNVTTVHSQKMIESRRRRM